MLSAIALYLCFGAVAGLLAGLLGVGGGLVIVPVMVLTLYHAGIEQHVMHLALGTSFATIVLTSVSSFIAHNRRGAVIWQIVHDVTPGIVAGVILGSMLATSLRTAYLQIFFVCFLFYTAVKMLRGIRPGKKKARAGQADATEPKLPGRPALSGMAGLIGFVSSLVGIGGGSLTVPFLVWCRIPIHKAVGTSAAVGLPIALTGAAMFFFNGWGAQGLPPYSFGFIYLPAFGGIAAASVLTAPIGTYLAHRLPVGALRAIFASLLIVTGLRMLWLVLAPWL